MSLEASVTRLAAAMESIAQIMTDGQTQLASEINKLDNTRAFPAPAPVAPAPVAPTTATVTPITPAAPISAAPTLDATRQALAVFARLDKANAVKVQASLTAMNAQKLTDLDDGQRTTLLAVLGIVA